MDTHDLGKPFLITQGGPKHDALAAKEPHDGPAANFYVTSNNEYTKNATDHALNQLHGQTGKVYHKLGDAISRPDSGAEKFGLGPDTAAKLHAVGREYDSIAQGHFDAERNNPHRVLNKQQFMRTERADGGHVNYQTDMS